MTPKNYLQNGYLNVGDEHKIYYETFGNPQGLNVLFLHGGPGLGFSDLDKTFFDPEHFHVIFFDQRGAGRSRPSGSIEQNTTLHLLEDISKLLDFLNIGKVLLFGGSWGSSLAVLYAIHQPARVNGMVLRGFFSANRQATDFYEKGAIAYFFPEEWQRFIDLVPKEKRNDPNAFYLEMMQSGDPQKSKKYAYELAHFGVSISKKNATPEEIADMLQRKKFEKNSLIQSYYSRHLFFIPDNFIFHHLEKIEHIPTRIIQGRYDMVCPPMYAYQLQEGLKNAKLIMLDAGHSPFESIMKKHLKNELFELLNLLGEK